MTAIHTLTLGRGTVQGTLSEMLDCLASKRADEAERRHIAQWIEAKLREKPHG